MDLFDRLGTAVAFLLASIVQSAIGFGLGPFAIPLVVWLGTPLESAVAMSLGVVTVHTAYGCIKTREHIVWREVGRMTLLRCLSIPAGVYVLQNHLNQSQTLAKQAVGAVLLVSVAVTWRRPAHVDVPPSRGWTWLTGIVSGLLAGSVGMGGPPLVLFALHHRWTKERIKSYLWATFLLGIPFAIAVMSLRAGLRPLLDWGIGILYAPVVWLGSRIGLTLSQNHSRETLGRVSLLVLGGIALLSLLSPWLESRS